MSADNPISEVDKQVHDIFFELNDPKAREIKRLAENKKKRAELIKKDVGL